MMGKKMVRESLKPVSVALGGLIDYRKEYDLVVCTNKVYIALVR